MMKLWEFVNELKSPAYCWVDLTHELSPATPHWYGFGDLTTEVIYDFSPDCIFHSDKYVIPAGQFGTHVDAPGHFVQGARTLDQMTLKEMVYPLVVVDKSAACAANADYELTIADLQEWEQEHGPIPEGAFVAFRSDWSKRADMNNYDENNQPHYPGWKLDALHWLVEERRIGAIGHETADTDAPWSQCQLCRRSLYLRNGSAASRTHDQPRRPSADRSRHLRHLPQGKKRRRLPSAGLCRLPQKE